MNMEFDETALIMTRSFLRFMRGTDCRSGFPAGGVCCLEVPFEALAQKMRTCKTEVGVSESILLHNPERFARRHDPGVTLDLTAQTDKTFRL